MAHAISIIAALVALGFAGASLFLIFSRNRATIGQALQGKLEPPSAEERVADIIRRTPID